MSHRLFLSSLVTAAAAVVAGGLAIAAARVGSGAASSLLFVAAGLVAAGPIAFGVAALFAAPLRRRAQAIAAAAATAARGDRGRTSPDFGSDELGATARAFDAVIQDLNRQLSGLSRDRARMEAILSGMVEGVLVVDRHGRLQLVNRAAREMLRIGPTTEGRPYLEVIRHPDIVAQLAGALRGKDGDSRELALSIDPARTFVARVAPVAQEGGGAVLVLHDITDLRRADQIRRDFVANVSHELRTPLTAIRGYLEALLDDPVDAASTQRFLEIAARHTTRMESLVTDLLRLARLDARQESLDLARCDIRQIFEDIAADLQPGIAAKRQHVVIDVPAGASEVDADRAKIHDAIRNLVENAVNYSPEDTPVELASARQNGVFAITVADRGPGIPPEDLTRVFERFYRVDKSRSRPGGTGLGLAIAKHLVELHGGTIAVVNRPEGGAMFSITLPGEKP